MGVPPAKLHEKPPFVGQAILPADSLSAGPAACKATWFFDSGPPIAISVSGRKIMYRLLTVFAAVFVVASPAGAQQYRRSATMVGDGGGGPAAGDKTTHN